MFRIDKRHVKISDQKPDPGAPKAPLDGQAETVAPEAREQPSLSVPEVPGAQETAAQALLEDARAEAEGILAKARQEAEDVLSGAKAMAAGILEDARTQAEQEGLEIRGQAWQAGQGEGMEAGRQAVLEEGRKLAQDIRTLVDGLHAGREALMGRLERDIIDLSLAVARKVLNAAIDREDEYYKALIQNALGQMKREGKLVIRLREADAERLFPGGTAVFTLGEQRVTAQISPDPYMKSGDCTLESEAEMVHAGIDSQLAAITVAFERVEETL